MNGTKMQFLASCHVAAVDLITLDDITNIYCCFCTSQIA